MVSGRRGEGDYGACASYHEPALALLALAALKRHTRYTTRRLTSVRWHHITVVP